MTRVSVLGGESQNRGFLGGKLGPERTWGIALSGTAAAVLLMGLRDMGVFPALIIVVAGVVLTWPTPRGSLLQRIVKKQAWKASVRDGTNVFIPYDAGIWDTLTADYKRARGSERKEVFKLMAGIRERPDGVDGMTFLQDGTGRPGIAWHRPEGGEAYLSVAFRTGGQIAGVESDDYLARCAEAFGRFTAQLGEHGSLASRVQVLTRMLPVDSAAHEQWVRDNLDETIDPVIAESYEEVIHRHRIGQLFQRHMVVISWPIDRTFLTRAARRGPVREGWISLMASEIASMKDRLRRAKFTDVSVLTARQTAAVIRHMQHPGYGIDQVADLRPAEAWLPSESEWSYITYTADVEGTGELTQSFTRTAVIRAENVEVAQRTSLWTLPMLTGMPEQVVHTVTFHMEVVPASIAREQARSDAASDRSNQQRDLVAGRETDSDDDVSLSAAQRRRADLRPGTGIQGASWVGFVSVSGRTRDELAQAVDAIEAAAGTAGIRRLEWLDPFQGVAASYTWPVGRGLIPTGTKMTDRVQNLVAGTGSKEEL